MNSLWPGVTDYIDQQLIANALRLSEPLVSDNDKPSSNPGAAQGETVAQSLQTFVSMFVELSKVLLDTDDTLGRTAKRLSAQLASLDEAEVCFFVSK